MIYYTIIGIVIGFGAGLALGYRVGYGEAMADMGRKR